jgi:hypothetical protein
VNDYHESGNTIVWILILGFLGIPFFFYEGSTLQNSVAVFFGVDIFTILMTVVAFGGFFYFIIPGIGSTRWRRTVAIFLIWISCLLIYGTTTNINDLTLAVQGKKTLSPPTIENGFKHIPNPPKSSMLTNINKLNNERNFLFAVLATGLVMFYPEIRKYSISKIK